MGQGIRSPTQLQSPFTPPDLMQYGDIQATGSQKDQRKKPIDNNMNNPGATASFGFKSIRGGGY